MLFALGDVIKLRIELWQRRRIKRKLRYAAFVVDRHRGLIRHRALNIVDADVVTKHRAGIGISLLDRRTGEPNEGRIRQRIAHIAREPIDEVVLAAMRLVSDHDDVLPITQARHLLALLGQKLLNGRKDHPSTCDR